jgi:hypothetical protein
MRHDRVGHRPSRRAWLAAGSAPLIVPARALGLGGTPPSDRVTVGIIGSGGRAVFETSQYPFFDNVTLVAVCDAQRSRRTSAKEKLEAAHANVGRGGPNRGIRMYEDFRELLAHKDIEAVYIASPDHWHVSMLIAAARAGKHIHCEKPLGVSVEQDLAALRALSGYKGVFQYGAERRSTAEARRGIELILNGRIGRVHKLFIVAPPSAPGGSPNPVTEPPPGFDYDLWLGPAPEKPFCVDRCLEGTGRNGIFNIYDYTLGNIANWAAHPLDLAQWWADNSGRRTVPVEYRGGGTIPKAGLFDVATNWDVVCTYDDGVVLHMVDHDTYKKYTDAPHPQMPFGRPGVTDVHNGAVFIGSEGWAIVSYEKVVFSQPSVMNSELGSGATRLIDSSLPSLPAGMPAAHQQVATAAHHQNWIRAIRGSGEAVGNIESAVRSDLISNLCDICIRSGDVVRWDAKHNRIEGNHSARRMVGRPMRAPWGVA